VTTMAHRSADARGQSGATNDLTEPDPEVPERARGPRRYSASYKAQILEEYERLDKAA
jgi:transposase